MPGFMQVINAADMCGSVLMCEVQYVCANTGGFSTHAASFNT